MDLLVSVIVPYCEDRKYLFRCLNAIKRQTYQNVEILMIGDKQQDAIGSEYNVNIVETDERTLYGGINKAVESARGEYIFFCSLSSILADNVLEELHKAISEKNADLSCGSICVQVGFDYEEYPEKLSIYGKLYKKSILCDIALNETSAYCEYEFVAKYLMKCQNIWENKNALIYETNRSIVDKHDSHGFEMEVWKRIFGLIGTDFILECGGAEKNNKVDCNIQDENEQKQIEYDLSYVKEDNHQTFLFLSKAEWAKREELVQEDALKAERVTEINKQKCIEEAMEQMTGDMLVNYVLCKYQNGKLGLKTIIKSLIAWIKYKF